MTEQETIEQQARRIIGKLTSINQCVCNFHYTRKKGNPRFYQVERQTIKELLDATEELVDKELDGKND